MLPGTTVFGFAPQAGNPKALRADSNRMVADRYRSLAHVRSFGYEGSRTFSRE